MELIQIGIYMEKDDEGNWIRKIEGGRRIGKWRRGMLKCRKKWVKRRRIGYGRVWTELILPINREEAKKQTTEWFVEYMKRIKKKYPNVIYYYTPEVCQAFDLAIYRKQWISWYFLFPQLWNMLEQQFSITGKRLDMVICDTRDERAKYLVSKLIDRAGKIEICTKQKEKWKTFSRECYEKEGLVLEFTAHLPNPGKEREKMIWDIDGTYYKKYGEWSKVHFIISPGLTEKQTDYVRFRCKRDRVVYDYKESLQGENISHKFAAILMQTMSWRICQLARSEAIFFTDREIMETALYYQWRLKELELI